MVFRWDAIQLVINLKTAQALGRGGLVKKCVNEIRRRHARRTGSRHALR
jgi:hypothetical protein